MIDQAASAGLEDLLATVPIPIGVTSVGYARPLPGTVTVEDGTNGQVVLRMPDRYLTALLSLIPDDPIECAVCGATDGPWQCLGGDCGDEHDPWDNDEDDEDDEEDL